MTPRRGPEEEDEIDPRYSTPAQDRMVIVALLATAAVSILATAAVLWVNLT